MSCNTIYHTPGGDAPRSAGMWWGPLDIIPQISIFRALYDPKKRANSPGYHFKAKRLCWNQGCTNCGILASWLLENGERMRKRERFTPYISSFSLYFLPLYPFPISKNVTFCGKMLYMALLSWMSQKLNIRAMEAPHAVQAWINRWHCHSLSFQENTFLVNQFGWNKIIMAKFQCVLSHYFTSFHETIYKGTNTCATCFHRLLDF